MRFLPIAAIGVLALSLTGCSMVTDLLHDETESEFADHAALQKDWPRADSAKWVPDGATVIHVRESGDGTVAILGFTSDAELDPERCVETDRLSAPSFTDDWAPAKVFVDRVFACGDWAVMATDDGWYGWTPSAPGEQEVAPAA